MDDQGASPPVPEDEVVVSPARDAARLRAAGHRAQEADMRRLAAEASLPQRREIYMAAARRFAALAELDEAVAMGERRGWMAP